MHHAPNPKLVTRDPRPAANSRVLLLLALLLVLPITGEAQQPPAPSGGATAAPAVYLMTMGQGDLVFEKFEHNAIWVHDPAGGTDYVYNYGVFDFNSPGYWSRFIQGDWLYELGVWPLDATLAAYQRDNRSVIVQELNLTPAQKAEVQRFLEWNALPENRVYRYDYFHDNCSTRIRDVIDAATGGALRDATERAPTRTTFRSHSERLIADAQLAYTGMTAGLGPAADREISQWEEMFLPGKVQERVREISVVGPEGSAAPLVLSERALVTANRPPPRAAAPNWIAAYLVIGLLLALLLAGSGAWAARAAMGRFAFAGLAALWSLLSGVGGWLLVGLWAATDHQIAWANENLFQFDPLSIGLVLLIPAVVYAVPWARRPAYIVAAAVAGLAVLGLLLQMLPWFDQGNGQIIALMLPPHIGLLAGLHLLSRRERGAAPAGAAPLQRPKRPRTAPSR